MTMEKRLSKAALILSLAGEGGLLVDDNYAKNIFDAHSKDACWHMLAFRPIFLKVPLWFSRRIYPYLPFRGRKL